jgi:FkbM family methyltransferase
MSLAEKVFSSYVVQMVKTIIEFVNSILLDLARHRWIKRLIGPLFPDIGFLDVSNPPLRVYLALQDMKGPSFHLLNRRQFGYEDYEKALRQDILKYLPEDGVFFDVGANIGLISYSTAMARPRARIFAFEPEPLSYLILNRTKQYNLLTQVDLIPLGLSDTTSLKTFYIDKANHGGHSLDRSQILNETRPSSILVSTVDQMIQTIGLTRLDVMKIDVQGLELEVLKGSLKSITDLSPVLTVEFTFNDKSNQKFFDFFKQLPVEYQFAEPGEDTLHSLHELADVMQKKKAQGFFYGDFFFVPKSKI